MRLYVGLFPYVAVVQLLQRAVSDARLVKIVGICFFYRYKVGRTDCLYCQSLRLDWDRRH